MKTNKSRVITLIAAFATGIAATAASLDGYTLVWQDLFDAETLNADRWNIEVNGNGGGNNELQFYSDSPSNVHVGDDGEGNRCLILTARRENSNGKSFTSGRVNSCRKVNFTYGRIDAAIKLPKTANGLWPAFWMMGDDITDYGWPRCGEIDVMEFGHANGINRGVQDRFFNGAAHWGPDGGHVYTANDATWPTSLQDGKFHVFTCIWTPLTIDMYVDLDKGNTNSYYHLDINGDWGNPYDATQYFHKPFHILFNLAIGGDFPGIHDPAGITALNPGNGNEASMYIDYVKVYQRGDAGQSLFATSGDDLAENPQQPDEPIVPDDPKPDDPEPSTFAYPYEVQPGVETLVSRGIKGATIYPLVLSDYAEGIFASQGAIVNRSLEPDGVTRNLYNWNNTYNISRSSTIGSDGTWTDLDTYIVNGHEGWSGAGYHVRSGNAILFNEKSRLHVAYRTDNSPKSAAFGLLMSATNEKAYIAVGNEPFLDDGRTYPLVGTLQGAGKWGAIDMSFGEIKEVYPSFTWDNIDWNDINVFSVLLGNTVGTDLTLDAVFYYNPDPMQYNDVTAVEALPCGSDEYYNLQGMRIAEPKGLCIRRRGNKAEIIKF